MYFPVLLSCGASPLLFVQIASVSLFINVGFTEIVKTAIINPDFVVID